MEYFLIWIPAGLAAFGALFLLANLIDKRTGIAWPKRCMVSAFEWSLLILVWIAMIPFALVALCTGSRISFDSANTPGLKRAPTSQRRNRE